MSHLAGFAEGKVNNRLLGSLWVSCHARPTRRVLAFGSWRAQETGSQERVINCPPGKAFSLSMNRRLSRCQSIHRSPLVTRESKNAFQTWRSPSHDFSLPRPCHKPWESHGRVSDRRSGAGVGHTCLLVTTTRQRVSFLAAVVTGEDVSHRQLRPAGPPKM